LFAVIFRAETKKIDKVYLEMAAKMRELAISKYGCTEFTSVVEGNQEIAISYWENQEQIAQWKKDVDHLVAQDLGRSKWYSAYQVQIVEIIHEYSKKT
jgi:heme-degrading monooxygenase HmoA